MHSYNVLVLFCAAILSIVAVTTANSRSSFGSARNSIEPILEAIRSENMANVRRLIVNQNLNIENRRGVTPLGVAVETDNDRIVALLIQNGASVNYPKGILTKAIEHGNDKIVDLLTQNGIDVNKVDFLGESPLHLAAYKGFEKIANALITNGANVNRADVSGKTALHQAAAFGREKVAELLIINGADVNQKDNDGKTPLHLAAEHGHTKVVDLLRLKGADIDIVDNRGRTAAQSVAALTRPNYGRNRNAPK